MKNKLIKLIGIFILGLIFAVGFYVYQGYQDKTADYKEVTLYFYDQTTFTGQFPIENGKLIPEKRCKDSHTVKNGSNYIRKCIGEYTVYQSKDKKDFVTDDIVKYEIKS